MLLTTQQKKEFEKLTKPVQKWLAKLSEDHIRMSVIINDNCSELLLSELETKYIENFRLYFAK